MSRSMRTFYLFVVALALGVTATWLANRWLQDRLTPADNADANTTAVVVAALEIPFGQKIELAHLKTIQWPNETIPDGTFDDVAKVEGKIANQMITKGELVLEKRVVEEVNGSTLSAILTPGKRAVTVRVNDVIGVGGFLLPGNRVDVLASRKDRDRRAHTKTLLEDLKVLVQLDFCRFESGIIDFSMFDILSKQICVNAMIHRRTGRSQKICDAGCPHEKHKEQKRIYIFSHFHPCSLSVERIRYPEFRTSEIRIVFANYFA